MKNDCATLTLIDDQKLLRLESPARPARDTSWKYGEAARREGARADVSGLALSELETSLRAVQVEDIMDRVVAMRRIVKAWIDQHATAFDVVWLRDRGDDAISARL